MPHHSFRSAPDQEWALTEGNLHRGLGSYVLTRCGRTSKGRWGGVQQIDVKNHILDPTLVRRSERVQQLKDLVKSKFQDANLKPLAFMTACIYICAVHAGAWNSEEGNIQLQICDGNTSPVWICCGYS